ncbi:ATP-dependent DNA ligase [Vibrio penaeicida]|uniref:ATP-dependent DNA ligase n=1 Tax=Vibrio penaeicida TaxID=104609 RepID=UPI001CC81563|nr:hypothetical protein [Vibrio penaeicida]
MSIQNLVTSLVKANGLKGINAKKELLSELDTVGQKGLRYLLDPKINYGIGAAKLPPHSGAMESEIGDDETFELLDKLASRELTGNAAKRALESFSSDSSPELHRFIQLCLKKSTGCGVGVTATNEIFPRLIPIFQVQKGKTYTSSLYSNWALNPLLGDETIVQVKENGWRVLASCNLDDQSVSFFTYTGNPIITVSHLRRPMLMLAMLLKFIDPRLADSTTIWIDGEGVYFHGDEVGTLQEAASALGHKREGEVETNIKFRAFDYFCDRSFTAGAEREPTATKIRYQRLKQAVSELNCAPELTGFCDIVKTWFVNSESEIFDIANGIIYAGGEGVMVKNPNEPYLFSKNDSWLKLKSVKTFDGTITEILAGDKGKELENTLGRIGVRLEDNGKTVYCGGGFSNELRDEIYANQDKFMNRKVELVAQEMTTDGSLQHSRFGRFRDTPELIGEKA